MALKIMHTSDLHLGMKFAGYEGQLREALVEARFQSLNRLVTVANENRCDLMVVAGDLFERVDVPKRDVIRAAQGLKEFAGSLVAVLPGNHDYLALDGAGPWDTLREKGGDNLLILTRGEPYDLTPHGLPAVLYPGPCIAKHAASNAIAWVSEVPTNKAIVHHIGVAHGSLEGVSPDFAGDYYPMTHQELEAGNISLWLLGHTHMRWPDLPGPGDRVFYAGTPEPDGFDCDHRGSAWIHDLGDDGSVKSMPVTGGQYWFHHDSVPVASAADLNAIPGRYGGPGFRKMLLKLKLTGRLPDDAYALLPDVRKAVEGAVAWLKFDDSEVTRQITAADIDERFTTGSFPHRLLMNLAASDEDFEALQEAHRLVMEVKK